MAFIDPVSRQPVELFETQGVLSRIAGTAFPDTGHLPFPIGLRVDRRVAAFFGRLAALL